MSSAPSFGRLAKLTDPPRIPLPASAPSEFVAQASELLVPTSRELIRPAAQGEVNHDDATMKILELIGKRRERDVATGDIATAGIDPVQRAGALSSGIYSRRQNLEIALVLSGTKTGGQEPRERVASKWILSREGLSLPPGLRRPRRISLAAVGRGGPSNSGHPSAAFPLGTEITGVIGSNSATPSPASPAAVSRLGTGSPRDPW